MNTEITIHPKLQHYGLTTANLDAMTDWYRKVLGMSVNHRATVPPEAQDRAPFSALHFSATMSWIIASCCLKCLVLRSTPTGAPHGTAACCFRMRHPGRPSSTYVRLKSLGVQPVWAADHGVASRSITRILTRTESRSMRAITAMPGPQPST